jgi:hypothetical protein
MLVGLIFLVNVPAFLRMGLDADPTFWDLCARNVLGGGVHYRDAVENNLPGMLWLHLVIRSTLGWSSEALRFADLLIVTAIAAMLLRWVPRGGMARLLCALVLAACYFSTSEWCHCQRDLWMLLPALVALHLRTRQLQRIELGESFGSMIGWAALEGAVWASGFWIKPHIASAAVAVWLAGVIATAGWHALRYSEGRGRMVRPSKDGAFPGLRAGKRLARMAADLAGLLLGGAVVGALGTAWIVETGGFPAFREIMFDWNRQYVGFDVTLGTSRIGTAMSVIFHVPWVLVNVAALPVAVCRLVATLRRGEGRPGNKDALLEALYVGWLLQTLLQHPYDYVFIPSTLLAIVVLARALSGAPVYVSAAALLTCLVLVVVARWPNTEARRIELLPACVLESSSARLKDDMSLYGAVNWQDLEKVADFLREQDIQDGELSCYGMRTMPLYELLAIAPSTRFYSLENCLVILERQRPLIKAELAKSRQRFVVHDLRRLGLSDQDIAAAQGKTLPIPQYRRPPLPWSERICFRAGRYVVLSVAAREMPVWIESSFGL